MAVTVVIVVLATFAIGVALGTVIMVAAAIRREDRAFSLIGPAPGAAARGARVLTGMHPRVADHSTNDLQHDAALNKAWQAANSQIGDSYKLMGPPPSGEIAGQQDE